MHGFPEFDWMVLVFPLNNSRKGTAGRSCSKARRLYAVSFEHVASLKQAKTDGKSDEDKSFFSY